MDPLKIGSFIKEIRKKNNLTQNDLANKYNVTYQAVSKWERGINLPDISLIKQMSKDFNISIDDLLEGKTNDNNKVLKNIAILLLAICIITGLIILISKTNNKNSSFDFKTITTNCSEFNVTGSLAYDKDKSSIYISQINYCGGDDKTNYKEIECNLYEKNNDETTLISSCKSNNENITLEEYLKDVKLNIDNYEQSCKKYNDDSLYLEINASVDDNKTIRYKIPLSLNNNCNNE